jgi:PKD repeat protein
LKENKQDIKLRELFREKLGNSEVIPDASVNLKLMRRLGRKEFLRFNPARFNSYYLGGILVATIAALIILSPGSRKPDPIPPSNNTSEIINIASALNNPDYGEKIVTQKSDIIGDKTSESIKKSPIRIPKVIAGNESDSKIATRENNSIEFKGVNNSFTNKSLYTDSTSEKNKLQSSFRKAEALFEVSSSEGCAPLNISFINKSGTLDSCRWVFGDGGYSNEKNPNWIFDVEGEYKVILNVVGSDGLVATSTKVITVHPKPLARFEIAPEKAILPKDEIRFYNYSTNANNFIWSFGDGSSSDLFEPRHIYNKYGIFNVSLIASSDYGCSDSLIVMNAFSGSEYFIDFPNAFIPNSQGPTGGYYSAKSDESAQVFHPVYSGVSEYQLKIFSKLGILIFGSSDVNIGWDGYFKGQSVDPGVYIWKVRGNFRNGESFIKTGNVTLLKN